MTTTPRSPPRPILTRKCRICKEPLNERHIKCGKYYHAVCYGVECDLDS